MVESQVPVAERVSLTEDKIEAKNENPKSERVEEEEIEMESSKVVRSV